MKIIGINNDMLISSACLIEDGVIIAAAAEERFSREKISRKFPTQAINYCLAEANTTIEQIDYIATSWNPGVYFGKFNPVYSGNRRHLVEQLYSVQDHLMEFYDRPDIDFMKQEAVGDFGNCTTYFITHHRAHAANGFFLSPFKHAAILTADSQGEYESTTFSSGNENKIELIKTINYPQSIGMFYATFTEFLGFKPNSDEWKVMALGAYAEDHSAYYDLIMKNIVTLLDDGLFELDLSYFNGFIHEQPCLYTSKMIELFGQPRKQNEPITSRHYEIAAAMQQVTEEVMTHMLNWLHLITKEDNLVVSGGAFMNSVYNGKITKKTPFKQVYISASPDDSGNSFGAAYYLYNHILGNKDRVEMTHNYYGPAFTNDEVLSVLNSYGLNYQKLDNPAKEAAKLISENNIIGWFQGKMEFGQRALGNRSILATPLIAEMKNKINAVIKFRESFRPFAPAILKEKQTEFFEMSYDDNVPFMEKVFYIKKDKRAVIPAVTHFDGTGRIQTVNKDTNALFYQLILEFEKITGVPVILNTSFNLNGEPIVCSPDDAIKTFYSCGMDALIINNYLISKK